MALDLVSMILANDYTDESLLGGGSLVGKNVTISSITPIDGGNRVTFSYTLDNGTVKTSTMDVMDGKDGADGYTPVKGTDYFDGQDGFSPIIEENENNTDKIYKLDVTTANGTFTTPNLKGADGQGGSGGSSTDEKVKFVVPSKTLNEISKLLSKGDSSKSASEEDSGNSQEDNEEICHIFINSKNIIFEISGYCVVSRLLEGEFHNYKASIPSDFKTEVIIKTREFYDSIERCSLLINEKNKCPVRCVFEDGSLKIDCKTSIGKINDSIPAEVNGEFIEIGFNNKFLLDALKACETDKIKIQLMAANKPVRIVPTNGDSFMYLLMPIQLKK